MIISGAISGIGSALTWVAQGAYVSNCASDRNKGLFNGYAIIVFNLAMIFGNFTGGFLIARVTYTTYYTVIPCITICAVFFFIGVKKPDQVVEDEPETELKALDLVSQETSVSTTILVQEEKVIDVFKLLI